MYEYIIVSIIVTIIIGIIIWQLISTNSTANDNIKPLIKSELKDYATNIDVLEKTNVLSNKLDVLNESVNIINEELKSYYTKDNIKPLIKSELTNYVTNIDVSEKTNALSNKLNVLNDSVNIINEKLKSSSYPKTENTLEKYFSNKNIIFDKTTLLNDIKEIDTEFFKNCTHQNINPDTITCYIYHHASLNLDSTIAFVLLVEAYLQTVRPPPPGFPNIKERISYDKNKKIVIINKYFMLQLLNLPDTGSYALQDFISAMSMNFHAMIYLGSDPEKSKLLGIKDCTICDNKIFKTRSVLEEGQVKYLSSLRKNGNL